MGKADKASINVFKSRMKDYVVNNNGVTREDFQFFCATNIPSGYEHLIEDCIGWFDSLSVLIKREVSLVHKTN